MCVTSWICLFGCHGNQIQSESTSHLKMEGYISLQGTDGAGSCVMSEIRSLVPMVVVFGEIAREYYSGPTYDAHVTISSSSSSNSSNGSSGSSSR